MSRVVRIAVCVLLLLVVLVGEGWTTSNSSEISEASESHKASSSADSVGHGKATLFLSGVVIYGENRSALFEVKCGNQTTKRQVREGEKIGGYTLDKVEKDRVILSYRGKKSVLLLKRGRIEAVSEKKGEEKKRDKGENAGENVAEKDERNVTVVKRYAPGEIDLSEHKEEVQRGILKILEQLYNFEENNQQQK